MGVAVHDVPGRSAVYGRHRREARPPDETSIPQPGPPLLVREASQINVTEVLVSLVGKTRTFPYQVMAITTVSTTKRASRARAVPTVKQSGWCPHATGYNSTQEPCLLLTMLAIPTVLSPGIFRLVHFAFKQLEVIRVSIVVWMGASHFQATAG